MLTDEQLRDIYRRTSSTPKYLEWRKDRVTRLARFQKWLLNVAGSGTDTDLRSGYLEHFGDPFQSLNAIYRERVVKDPGKFRKAVRGLLDESIPIVSRLDRLLDGSEHIEGMGRGLSTEYLMIAHPDKYCLWNSKTENGLTALERMPTFTSSQSSGERYGMILQAVTDLRDIIGSTDYPDTDQFLHFVGAPEDEGREALAAVSNPRLDSALNVSPASMAPTPVVPDQTSYVLTPGLESRLEEFIESNLERIGREKLGLNLALFQDEEGNGRQYTTPVGRIDLLTRDKDGKTWVVFELKRDIARDDAVGQILRYVEWVKANRAAADESVRGMIIAAGQDKGLEYSLRALPNVHLYTYAISFDLKPSEFAKSGT